MGINSNLAMQLSNSGHTAWGMMRSTLSRQAYPVKAAEACGDVQIPQQGILGQLDCHSVGDPCTGQSGIEHLGQVLGVRELANDSLTTQVGTTLAHGRQLGRLDQAGDNAGWIVLGRYVGHSADWADQTAVTFSNTDREIGGLTILAPPPQAEDQALRHKCKELADDVGALSELVHALRALW